jgi:hypothetical protein
MVVTFEPSPAMVSQSSWISLSLHLILIILAPAPTTPTTTFPAEWRPQAPLLPDHATPVLLLFWLSLSLSPPPLQPFNHMHQ